jgi:two-component system, cell cycle sensor histidine kinase and response regulator CckA
MSTAQTTILIVDDEPNVLSTLCDGLAAQGYNVLKATSGDEALRVASAHAGPIGLLLIDVVMPGQSGPQVAAALRQSRPDAKLLYMSGFGSSVVVNHGLQLGDPLIVKPFTLQALGEMVKELLAYRSPFSRPPQPPAR